MKDLSFRMIAFAALLPLLVLCFSAAERGTEAAGGAAMVREAVELYVGEKDTLELSGKAAVGVRWSSSDEGVVTVDNNGEVTGISPGEAFVSCENGGVTLTCHIFVVEKEYSFDDDIMISIFWPPTQEYVNDEQYKYMADAGITWVMGAGDNLGAKDVQLKMLELCYKYGIHMTVGDSRLGSNLVGMSERSVQKILKEYRNVPGANGYYLLDEPYNANPYVDAYRTLKKEDPNSYMHLNFMPYAAYPSLEVYKAQMNDWLKLCAYSGYRQDYLMYDLYPFGLEKGSMNRTAFLLNLEAVREVGLKNGVKTGTYIQSVTQSVAFRSPTEEETRYEINMSLAFGVKQLSYFTWFTPHDRSEPFEDGIISCDGVPNPKYEFILRLNKEVKNLGPVLARCDSLEVYGSRNTYDAIELIPDDFFVHGTDKKDFTAAYLRDRENGRNYLMVVNNSFAKAQTFSLRFDDEIGSLQFISEKDGKTYQQELDAVNVARFELGAGGARLFVLPEGYDFAKRRVRTPQKGENLALSADITCNSSAGTGGYYMWALNDGDRYGDGGILGWATDGDTDVGVAVIDLGVETEFNRIDVYPSGSVFDYGKYMPGSFTLAVSRDGEHWQKLASAVDFKIVGDTVPSVRFGAVKARYIRFSASDLNEGRLEISEIEIYDDDGTVPPPVSAASRVTEKRGEKTVRYKPGKSIASGKEVTVSSYPAGSDYKSWGWWPDFLVDGSEKGWTSDVKRHMDSPDAEEYAIIDLGDFFIPESVEVTPQGCWPKDFEILVSKDRISWETVASEKNSKTPSKTYKAELNGQDPVRYVMFRATRLRGTAADGYMLQIGEIAVYGRPWKDAEEARRLIETYVENGGSENSEAVKAVRDALADENATQSQLDKKLAAMLAEVSLELEPRTSASDESFKYDITVEADPFGTAGDTVIPTKGPAKDDADDGETGRKGCGGVIGTLSAIVLAAAVLPATAAAHKNTLCRRHDRRK